MARTRKVAPVEVKVARMKAKIAAYEARVELKNSITTLIRDVTEMQTKPSDGWKTGAITILQRIQARL